MKQLLSLMAILNASISVHAQSKVLESITANAKTSATNKVVETANKTVNKTLDKILDGDIFKKKAKAGNTDTQSEVIQQSVAISNNSGATQLTINNTDYSSVVALSDIIKSNKNVKDVQRTFANGSGVLNITHSSKTEDLLDDVLKNTSGKYEVAEVTTGKITLVAKK